MIYAIIVLGIALLAIYVFVVRPMARARKVKTGISAVQMAVAYFMIRKLTPKLGQEMAARVAAAASNEIFSAEPTNERGRLFLTEHRELVRDYAKALSRERELCQLISEAVFWKCFSEGAMGMSDADHMFGPMDNLRELGLYSPRSESEHPDWGSFHRNALCFLQRIQRTQ